MSNAEKKLQKLNDILLISGIDYSDVLLDASADIKRQRAEIERLRQQVTQRGARMQLMRGYMWSYSGSGTTLWNDFCRVVPDATRWFDADGVPK